MENRINISKDYLSRIIDSITSTVPTEEVYIFGSYARGEERKDSDMDLYIVTSDDAEARFERMGRVAKALLWMRTPKDILLNSKIRFAAKRDDISEIEYQVYREGIKVYG